MGAAVPLKVTVTPPSVVGSGPCTIPVGVRTPEREFAKLVPVMVTMEPGDAPGWKLAPLTMAAMVGVGGATGLATSVNWVEKPLADAVTTILPGVEPAVAVTKACPLVPVVAAAVLRVALPLVTA